MADKTAAVSTDTGSEKMHEALRLANEAVKEMGSDARQAVVDKYDHLKDLFVQSKAGERLAHAKEVSAEKCKELGSRVDESVKEKPYHYIAGAALVGVVVGVLLSRKF